MGTEFRDFINATGRVIVLPSPEQPLPLDVRVRVADQARWLRREKIPALDAEIGHLFPLVVIHPSCWTRLSADGTPGILSHARVGPFETSAGTVFAVHVAAASLLAFERELFDGVLAHEFPHYVWFSLRVIDAARAGMETVDLNVRGYSESITNVQKYRRLDKQLAVPASANGPKRTAARN